VLPLLLLLLLLMLLLPLLPRYDIIGTDGELMVGVAGTVEGADAAKPRPNGGDDACFCCWCGSTCGGRDRVCRVGGTPWVVEGGGG